MYGINELKKRIKITDKTVECPVKSCTIEVNRRRRGNNKNSSFECSLHDIYISPSTFEYKNYLDNLIWKDRSDLDLLQSIKNVKRSCRFNHDNDEDAVTWNVFRFLEKNNLLSYYLSDLVDNKISYPKIIYWSYSKTQGDIWSELQKAREEFEIRPKKGSEPDIIINSDEAIIFIEAKINASNNTTCKSKNPLVKDKYFSGGSNWFNKVIKSDYETVVLDEKKYELFRFWLLGSWIANMRKKNFYLINLVLQKNDKDIEKIFRNHIIQGNKRKFLRICWEDIYKILVKSDYKSPNKDKLIDYLKNKSIGYRKKGVYGYLEKAFSI